MSAISVSLNSSAEYINFINRDTIDKTILPTAIWVLFILYCLTASIIKHSLKRVKNIYFIR